MRIVPIDNIADDQHTCDGCGQLIEHGESALVPDDDLLNGARTDAASDHVASRSFALCLGCLVDGAQALDGCAFDSQRSKAYAETFRALRDLRAALPLLTGRPITPAEQVVLDAASAWSHAKGPKGRARMVVSGSADSVLAHALRLARNQGWKG